MVGLVDHVNVFGLVETPKAVARKTQVTAELQNSMNMKEKVDADES